MNQEIFKMMAKAIQCFQSENYDEAERILSKVLKLQPKNFDALHISGVMKGVKNQHQEALEFFRKALRIDPNNSWLNFNIAKAFSEIGDEDKALKYHWNATKLNPSHPEAWVNFGTSLSNLKKFKESLECLITAIDLRPDYAEAWTNRGVVLTKLEQFEEALASFDESLKINSQIAETWSNRGNTLLELKQYEQALASYDKAISIKPNYADAWSNRGNTLREIGHFFLAVASYREAIRLNPEFLDARSNLSFTFNYVEKLSSHEAQTEAKRFGLKVSERAQPKFTTWDVPTRVEKLRIGFVSGDLRNHPVGYFVEGLLEQLNLSQFEIFAFPTTLTSDDLTNRIKPFFTEWTPINGISDQAASTLIHQNRIHVLIDLSGHTKHNRLGVFSYKPTPVQVSWLGYFATTGLPEMDYFLGDPQMSPASEANHFTENIWNLSETWLCLKPPVHTSSVSTSPALNNYFVTFGSFGNLSKMNDKVVETWSSLLHRIDKSRLILKSKQLGDPAQIEEVKNRFQKFNIPVERLILEGPESREAYFEAYQRVDIVLDTFPYPGGTTSVDSLWMGVPVLTLKGNRFLSHLGESIAINAGNSDWIAADVSDYVNKAVQFASDLDRLAQLRSTLRDRVLRSPLFDTPRFAKNFGEALWGMWNQRPQIKANLIEK